MKLFDEINISLEVIMLLVCGLAICIVGMVLFPVSTGALSYYDAGGFGLLLIMLGFQWQISGVTPVGFIKRSWPLILPGIVVTGLGFITCFFPGISGDLPKYLVVAIFGIGGLVQFLDLVYSKEKYPTWTEANDRLISHRLPLSCAIVFLFEILIAGIIAIQLIMPGVIPIALVAGFVLLFGISLIWMGVTLHEVYRVYPQKDRSTNTPGIPLDTVMMIQNGLFMLLFGGLILVSLGSLPVSSGAQHGVLALMIGIQVLLTGSMMGLSLRRNGLVLLLGTGLVAAGTLFVLLPDLSLVPLRIFIGVLNILGGLYIAYTIASAVIKTMTVRDILLLGSVAFVGVVLILFGLSTLILGLIPGTFWTAIGFLSIIGGICLISLVIKMFTVLVSLQLSLGALTVVLMIVFGISTFIPGLIPGIIIAIILAFWGLAMFLMLYVNGLIEKQGQPA